MLGVRESRDKAIDDGLMIRQSRWLFRVPCLILPSSRGYLDRIA
jgi:hypothetical protein